MAEFSARRVLALGAIAGALVGGVVAGSVAVVSASNNNTVGAGSSGGNGGSVSTAVVVRTTLSTNVQVGGSISYDRSYTVAAPSGTGAQQLAQDQQAVTADQQTLAAAEQAESDAASADNQATAAAQTSVDSASAAVQSDEAAKAKDCAGNGGSGSSGSACNQAVQKLAQDEAQLSQAQQQLTAAKGAAIRDHDQNAAQVQSASTKLQADQASLASAQAAAVVPGTTYTYLPPVGAVIEQDQTVYSLNDVPVPLLYGSLVAYRAFYVGMSPGPDVGELTHDLIALGDGAGLSETDTYSAATAVAVERWQASRGLATTGELLLGAVVFEPGPIRVTSVTPALGGFTGGAGAGSGGGGGGGNVLTATSTTPVVSVDLDVSQEYLVKPGDAVSIVLPNGSSTVGGRIESVGNVATCPGGGGIGLGGGVGGGTADQSPCASGGTNSAPTVPLTITLDRVPPGAALDEAPVNVNITSQRAVGVLAVPVNALLALQGGGYGVDVVSGHTVKLVGVSTGLYANTMVQVSGPGITSGTRVQVPSS